MYLYPPTQLIGEVLCHIQLVSCCTILIALAWPTQYWFPLLLSLVVDHPRRLLTICTLLRQQYTGQFHLASHRLALHMWPLSSPPSSDTATQRQWQGKLPLPTNSLPTWCTRASGGSSQNAVGIIPRSILYHYTYPTQVPDPSVYSQELCTSDHCRLPHYSGQHTGEGHWFMPLR